MLFYVLPFSICVFRTHLVLPRVQIHDQILRLRILIAHFAFITVLVCCHFFRIKCQIRWFMTSLRGDSDLYIFCGGAFASKKQKKRLRDFVKALLAKSKMFSKRRLFGALTTFPKRVLAKTRQSLRSKGTLIRNFHCWRLIRLVSFPHKY